MSATEFLSSKRARDCAAHPLNVDSVACSKRLPFTRTGWGATRKRALSPSLPKAGSLQSLRDTDARFGSAGSSRLAAKAVRFAKLSRCKTWTRRPRSYSDSGTSAGRRERALAPRPASSALQLLIPGKKIDAMLFGTRQQRESQPAPRLGTHTLNP